MIKIVVICLIITVFIFRREIFRLFFHGNKLFHVILQIIYSYYIFSSQNIINIKIILMITSHTLLGITMGSEYHGFFPLGKKTLIFLNPHEITYIYENKLSKFCYYIVNYYTVNE